MNRTFIIAEIAGCHEGDLHRACDLIEAAQQAGASAVKTQWCSNIDKMAVRRQIDEATAYDRLAFPRVWAGYLAARCHQYGMEYIVTIFLPEDVQAAAQYADRLKIASLEAADIELVRACLETQRRVIISMGCMTAEECIDLQSKYIKMAHNDQVSFLHTTAAYPVPVGETNLACLEWFDGYSDQTGRVLTGALAVMAGASMLEVHMRLDDTDPSNPDFGHSLTPAQLMEYVRLVRLAEQERGDGVKVVQPSEEPLRQHRVVRP